MSTFGREERRMKEYIVPFTDGADMEKFEAEHGTNGELIRCKDCKYWGTSWYRYGCVNATPIMMENDYCSNAERKEDGTDK